MDFEDKLMHTNYNGLNNINDDASQNDEAKKNISTKISKDDRENIDIKVNSISKGKQTLQNKTKSKINE